MDSVYLGGVDISLARDRAARPSAELGFSQRSARARVPFPG